VIERRRSRSFNSKLNTQNSKLFSMTFDHFSARAHQIFEEIPPQFREGVDGLVIERRAEPHPELPEIYTLGECRTEQYPSDFGGPGTIRSFVVLFYGSFVRLSELDEGWDWEEELFETITHEVRHHLESLASEDALEVEDWVMDQNFARREGKPFDPSFFRGGEPIAEGVFDVDGDVFLEQEIGPEAIAEGSLVLEWEDREARVPLPQPLGDTHFLTVEGLDDEGGELVLVLIRRRGVWESIRSAFGGGSRVEQSRARAEPVG
jgi:hypothetical protein